MNKYYLLIASIILTILTIIYIILAYFEITRYIYLRYTSTTSLVEKYKNLPKFTDKKVAINICTKSNISSHTINSLLDQTTSVNEFIVSQYDENDKEVKYLKDICVFLPQVESTKTCILNVLHRQKEQDTIIINIKSNIVYGKDFVESVVEEIEKVKRPILSKSSEYVVFKPEQMKEDNLPKNDEEFMNWVLQNAEISNYNGNYSC